MPASSTTKQDRRVATEQKLVEAVGEVMQSKGFGGLGVNAIAKAAGVPKSLIYRYFNGLEGLIRAFGESGRFWPSVDDVLGPEREVLELEDPAKIGREIFVRYAQVLRSRPMTLELLAWECSERPPLLAILEDVRQEFSAQLGEALASSGIPFPPSIWLAADIFAGAINYFAVRGRHIRIFGTLDIQSDEGWEQMLDAMETIFRALMLESPTPE